MCLYVTFEFKWCSSRRSIEFTVNSYTAARRFGVFCLPSMRICIMHWTIKLLLLVGLNMFLCVCWWRWADWMRRAILVGVFYLFIFAHFRIIPVSTVTSCNFHIGLRQREFNWIRQGNISIKSTRKFVYFVVLHWSEIRCALVESAKLGKEFYEISQKLNLNGNSWPRFRQIGEGEITWAPKLS